MPIGIGLGISDVFDDQDVASGPPPTPSFLLQETGDYLLQETGDKIIL